MDLMMQNLTQEQLGSFPLRIREALLELILLDDFPAVQKITRWGHFSTGMAGQP